MPVMICGDLNSLPDSGVLEFLLNSRLSSAHTDFGQHDYSRYLNQRTLQHSLRLASPYPTSLPFTNYTETFKGVIDYILFTSGSLLPLSVLSPVDPVRIHICDYLSLF